MSKTGTHSMSNAGDITYTTGNDRMSQKPLFASYFVLDLLSASYHEKLLKDTKNLNY